MDFQLTIDCYLWRILKNFIGGSLPSYLFPLLHRDANSHIYLPELWELRSYYCPWPHPQTSLLSEKLLFVCSCYCTVLRHNAGICHVLSSAAHLHCSRWDFTQSPALLTATAPSRGTTRFLFTSLIFLFLIFPLLWFLAFAQQKLVTIELDNEWTPSFCSVNKYIKAKWVLLLSLSWLCYLRLRHLNLFGSSIKRRGVCTVC